MLESLVLGTIQGITEWLPVSSEAAVILANLHLFDREAGLAEMVRLALFLHLGTFFAALWYFREDVRRLFVGLFTFPAASPETRRMLVFLFAATLASGATGFLLLGFVERMAEWGGLSGKVLMGGIGLLLLLTGAFQVRARKTRKGTFALKGAGEVTFRDGLLLGVLQGASVLPGLSRSGITISVLLLRRFHEVQALRLSFLMSLPAVLGGNIVLQTNEFAFSFSGLLGLGAAFLFGFLTIHVLVGVARKIDFGYFTIVFGLLTLAALLL
ncbi:MAG: undecaprenyl-diphosphate phosphatase [Patescibacteria group bacterium]